MGYLLVTLDYPSGADLIRFLYASNLVDSAVSPSGRAGSLDYAGAAAAAATEFARRTNRTFAATTTTQSYDAPTDAEYTLDLLGDWARITGITRDGAALVAGTDYRLRPLDGPPYRFVEFVAGQMEPLPWGSRATLAVTGLKGTSAGVPDDVFQACLQRAGATLAPSLHGTISGNAKRIRQADAEIEYAWVAGPLGDYWTAAFERCVDTYAMGGLIF